MGYGHARHFAVGKMSMHELRLGMIGYGEVGGIFTAALAPQVAEVRAWDIKFADPCEAESLRVRAVRGGANACPSIAELCASSDFVICAITAANVEAVAREAAAHLRPGTIYLDLNSASPGAKQRAAALVNGAGGNYVEAGVMASVPPHGIRVPMLLGGPSAAIVAPQLQAWGMNVTVVSDKLGIASAIKMCRSVMIKGLEALVVECYSTARSYGVEEHVLPTLHKTFPSIDWNAQGRYFFSRVVAHGRRRAEEMREVAVTVCDAGLDPRMTSAIALEQDWVADLAANGAFSDVTEADTWQVYADHIIESLHK